MPLILKEIIFKTNALQKNGWTELAAHFNKPYLQEIANFLAQKKAQNVAIYPPFELIFKAFELTSLAQVKVVILGQDPYHNFGQANGLSFSVAKGVKIPPSLRNIFAAAGIKNPANGDLTNWAKQGVLLMNSVLTVEHGKASSHQKLGWQIFTDAAISLVSSKCTNVVFMLWGNFAAAKKELIDASKHLVLMAPHPSPLAAYRGFLDCRHFELANQYLRAHKKSEINWQLGYNSQLF